MPASAMYLSKYSISVWIGMIIGICFSNSAHSQDNTGLFNINPAEAAVIKKLAPFLRERDYVVHISYHTDTLRESASASDLNIREDFGELPGIYNPSYFLKDRDTLPQTASVPRVRYRKSKLVEVVLSDIYDDRDVAFIRDLVRMSLPLNERKGDSIAVYERKFPKIPFQSDLLARDSTVDSNTTAAASLPGYSFPNGPVYNNTFTSPSAAPSTNRVDSERNTVTQQTAGTQLWSDYNLPFMLLALLMLLIIGLLIWVLVSSRSARNADNKQDFHQQWHAMQAAEKKEESNGNGEVEEQRQQLISYFIKNPRSVADVIENDLLSGGHEAVGKYGRAVASVNPELVHLIEPYLLESTCLNLQQRIREFAGSGDQASYEIKQVLSKLKNLQESDGKSIFGFLGRINDQQLLFMLREENADTIAITLAQLKGDRARQILSKFDSAKRADILARMGMIGRHPSRVFRDVALRLNEKLPELEGMNDLTIDGVNGVLNILDDLSEDEQTDMLTSIREQAPDLASALSKEFLGFSNILQVDDKVLEFAIKDIETEQLVGALTGYDEDIIDKIVNLRPNREQLVLRSQIALNGSSGESGSETRKKIVYSIRNQLRKA